MSKISIIGYPRIGEKRELKKITESYLKGKSSKEELLKEAKELRKKNWMTQHKKGVDFIPSNDFSFYDTFLDTAFALNIIPSRYKNLGLDDIDIYFAMAKGYQKNGIDVRALEMKKWFNTNYHYIVPELEDDVDIRLNGSKMFDECSEAESLKIKTRPVITGPFTLLKLCKIKSEKTLSDYITPVLNVYKEIIKRLDNLKIEFLQLDEPALVKDLTEEDISIFIKIYEKLLSDRGNIKILLQTYFGDVRDVYEKVISMEFDAIGLDFVEGEKTLELIREYGFPKNTILFTGIINGKNIWKNNYEKSINIIRELSERYIDKNRLVLNTSCSLLHTPYTLRNETKMKNEYRVQMAFAEEKLDELKDLKILMDDPDYKKNSIYIKNQEIISSKQNLKEFYSSKIREKIKSLKDNDFKREPSFSERIKKQHALLRLPILPTTTIGSFPQTQEVRKLRNSFKNGEISQEEYKEEIKNKIKEVIALQEKIDLDVLVHGEFERNDMVEYFGENLKGFLFTENGWVQSYGTRGVKPPIIFGDVERVNPITIEWIKYAHDLTNKPVKGMLTGPVTILNWSFPREDMSLEEICFQIGLAIKDEVMDLEESGIGIIQIDEAALREKLPLRKSNWKSNYLEWAIKAFRLVHSSVKPETQIHTHMCYSDFDDIIEEISDMDADVITIESAKSDLRMLDVLNNNNYDKEVGPGVYDIHSPRVPSIEEFETQISKLIDKLNYKRLWINPDCGLKTRGEEETVKSLNNMLSAVKNLRKKYNK